ncbi:TetR family transcriptional regulator [Rhodococcus sp. ABRD24]|uniref:TetR/AcrR family transcriptional regulator n=1 Tax=Rhodococcus sp. ABRD24 TaxID=2507582 RepID=UPI0013F16A34|nr:TetR family transcriptional regulator [Rhodococcus sp. ABRD24]
MAREDDSLDRRSRISRAAEHLFSERAYEAVSIRDIAADAGVNSALIRYYFGTKDELYRALFTDRYQVISAERMAGLTAVPDGLPARESLRAIIRAWIAPVARLACREGDANFLMLLARDLLRRDDEMHSGFREELDTMALECIAALKNCAADATESQVITAYTWFVSLAVNATANRRRAARLTSSGRPEPIDETEYVDSLVAFVTPGVAAMLGLGLSTQN